MLRKEELMDFVSHIVRSMGVSPYNPLYEDIISEGVVTCLKKWNTYDDFRGTEKTTYFGNVARRRAASFLKTERRQRERIDRYGTYHKNRMDFNDFVAKNKNNVEIAIKTMKNDYPLLYKLLVEKKTLQSVGDKEELTRERIRQIRNIQLAKIRGRLEDMDVSPVPLK